MRLITNGFLLILIPQIVTGNSDHVYYNFTNLFSDIDSITLILTSKSPDLNFVHRIQNKFDSKTYEIYEIIDFESKPMEEELCYYWQPIDKINLFDESIRNYTGNQTISTDDEQIDSMIFSGSDILMYTDEIVKWTERNFTKNSERNFAKLKRCHKPNSGHIGYIIQIIDPLDLPRIVGCLVEPLGTYLFIIRPIQPLPDTEFLVRLLEKTLRSAWVNNGALRVYVSLNREIFTFDPMEWNWDTKEYGLLRKLSNTKKNRPELLDNMNGYPLRVELFASVYSIPIFDKLTNQIKFYGIDFIVVTALQQVMNFTIYLQKTDSDYFGYRMANGKFTGTIGRLIGNQSDIGMTGFFIKDYQTDKIEFTTPVNTDEMCLVVKKSGNIPAALRPLLTFKPQIWFCLFGCIPICVLSSLAIGYGRNVKVDRMKMFTDTVQLIFSVPIRLPKSTIERMLTIPIAITSLILVSIFQSQMATIYIKPFYYRDIDTLQEFDATGLNVAVTFPGLMDDLFVENVSETYNNLRAKLQLQQVTLQDVARDGHVALATRKSLTLLENSQWFITNRLHMVRECPKSYNIAFLVRKNSMYLERINGILLRMINGGLINKWLGQMEYNVTLTNLRLGIYGEAYQRPFRVLDNHDLILAYYVLIGGTILSTLVFYIEICLN